MKQTATQWRMMKGQCKIGRHIQSNRYTTHNQGTQRMWGHCILSYPILEWTPQPLSWNDLWTNSERYQHFKNLHFIYFVYTWSVSDSVGLWKPWWACEGKKVTLVLSFHHEGSGLRTWVLRLGSKCLYLLSHIMGSGILLLKRIDHKE